MNVLKRIERLQCRKGSGENKSLKLIDAGCYYDELSDADKDAYCEYRHYDRQIMEKVELAVTGTLHFVLRKIPKPEPLEKVQKEIALLTERY